MSHFRFRLATVMKLRQQTRDARRAELTKAFEAEAILQEQVNNIRSQLNDARSIERSLIDAGQLDVDKLLSHRRYQIQLIAHKRQLKEHEQQLAEEIERRRAAVVEADRDVKILETLNEKQWSAFQLEQRRKDHNQLNEVAVQAFQRKTASELE